MASRHKSRILAMQFLFSLDINQVWDEFEVKKVNFCEKFELTPESIPHFFDVINGVKKHKEQLEVLIKESSKNWSIGRISGVDRNIMKIAIYEMLYCADVPPKVAINEAIDIGKRFGTEDSGAFINGILDNIHKNLEID